VPNNPLTNIWQFVTATTDDYLAIGPWRFLLLALFWLLLIAGIVIAVRNWQADPAQRNGRTLGIAFTRILIGCMWFQGSLWKLPLPASEGLRYWTEQEARGIHGPSEPDQERRAAKPASVGTDRLSG
jgi:hypothetical protein